MFSPGSTGYFGYHAANKQLVSALRVLESCVEQCMEVDRSNSPDLLEAIEFINSGLDARYCLRFRQALLIDNQVLRQRDAKIALQNIIRQIPPSLIGGFSSAHR